MAKRKSQWGGSWTDVKLSVFEEYLRAYTTALKNQPFRLMYVDAFAGAGHRASNDAGSMSPGLFEMPEKDEFAKGSARVALEVNPPFGEYVFIEKDRESFAALKKLEDEFQERRGRMRFIKEDANTAVVKLCRTTDWNRTRAVMFLDPSGMQVNWSTVEMVATTEAIDLWYLVATGMGLNRLMRRDGKIPAAWEKKLNRMLGDTGWRQEFYVETRQKDLFFGNETPREKVYDTERAEKYILDRLKQIFVGGVAERALPLENSKGQCMYLLTFACGNKRGARVALPIVRHVIKKHLRNSVRN